MIKVTIQLAAFTLFLATTACHSSNPSGGSGTAMGGTSSGGPPADVIFYSHCADKEGIISMDLTGSSGYGGFDGSARLYCGSCSPQYEWTQVKLHHNVDWSNNTDTIQVNLPANGTTLTTFKGFSYSGTQSSPAQWTAIFEGVMVNCKGYLAGPCQDGLIPVNLSPGLGTQVCINP